MDGKIKKLYKKLKNDEKMKGEIKKVEKYKNKKEMTEKHN